MENHKELTLSDLWRYIIRYGAKYMEAFESDLFYDCKSVEKMDAGDSFFWMVSASHTYLYSAKMLRELGVDGCVGNRFNFRIDCTKGKFGDKEYAMTRVEVWNIKEEVANHI